jgi:hypothetical protein
VKKHTEKDLCVVVLCVVVLQEEIINQLKHGLQEVWAIFVDCCAESITLQ